MEEQQHFAAQTEESPEKEVVIDLSASFIPGTRPVKKNSKFSLHQRRCSLKTHEDKRGLQPRVQTIGKKTDFSHDTICN